MKMFDMPLQAIQKAKNSQKYLNYICIMYIYIYTCQVLFLQQQPTPRTQLFEARIRWRLESTSKLKSVVHLSLASPRRAPSPYPWIEWCPPPRPWCCLNKGGRGSENHKSGDPETARNFTSSGGDQRPRHQVAENFSSRKLLIIGKLFTLFEKKSFQGSTIHTTPATSNYCDCACHTK